MYAQFIKRLDDVRASYWFIPLCMLFASILLALFTRWLDSQSYIDHFFYSASIVASGATDARTLLSTIASAVMGVAGVTFSITIVAVSFASSNFGPRLISNFMRDQGNQITLGTFTGTFTFCLIILSTVHGESEGESGDVIVSFVPYISVMTALVLALGCIGVLIYFVHHIAETINIENIVADIGHQLRNRITEIYPENVDGEAMVEAVDFNSAIAAMAVGRIQCESTGYVQAIDHGKLNEVAARAGLLIDVHYRPGDFITTQDTLLSVWHPHREALPTDELKSCFATGPQRTEHQNVLFLVEQLAEVIGRALSPGVNDPFTAVSCLNWYRVVIQEYIESNIGDDKEAGDKEAGDKLAQGLTKRVQVSEVTFERLTAVMFDSVRQYIVSDLNALLHCMAVLTECAWHASDSKYRQVLDRQLEQFHEAGVQTHPVSVDKAAITARYERSLTVLGKNEPHLTEHDRLRWFGGSA